MTVFGPRRRVLVIPSATIARVAATLESHGRIPRGYLGLGLRLVALEGGRSGAMVMNVDPQGPGASAGIYQGDIVIDWNNEPIRHVQSVLHALGPDSIGQTVTNGGGSGRHAFGAKDRLQHPWPRQVLAREASPGVQAIEDMGALDNTVTRSHIEPDDWPQRLTTNSPFGRTRGSAYKFPGCYPSERKSSAATSTTCVP